MSDRMVGREPRARCDEGSYGHRPQRGARAALADALQCQDGGWSCMRITTLLICVVVLGMWVAFCFIEGRFVPISWEMVTLVAGSQGAKAAQLRFELGRGGLASYDPSEGVGLR